MDVASAYKFDNARGIIYVNISKYRMFKCKKRKTSIFISDGMLE
jgi:hypothetical protein